MNSAGVRSCPARARARAIIGSEMSMPMQRPAAPSVRATASVVLPVPQPTSSTAREDVAATASTSRSRVVRTDDRARPANPPRRVLRRRSTTLSARCQFPVCHPWLTSLRVGIGRAISPCRRGSPARSRALPAHVLLTYSLSRWKRPFLSATRDVFLQLPRQTVGRRCCDVECDPCDDGCGDDDVDGCDESAAHRSGPGHRTERGRRHQSECRERWPSMLETSPACESGSPMQLWRAWSVLARSF